MTTNEGLSASAVSKSFYGNRVLNALDLSIPKGRLHALLGHNGSGKSTFIKILAGYYTPDPGSGPIAVDGVELVPGDPDSSHDAGISFVHQTLGLVPGLSVLENLRLGKPWQTNRLRKIAWSKERELARKALSEFGVRAHPDALVRELSTVSQTEVAIVRALSEGDHIKVLVLDEVTASLTDHEVQKLFATIDRVKQGGVSILYVTHRLEEIQLIADEVTVLRDGTAVGTGPVADFPPDKLVRLVAGDDRPTSAPVDVASDAVNATNGGGDGDPLFEVIGLKAGELRDANLAGQPGEIVGVVGLLGSGVIDLADALTGRLLVQSGEVRLAGRRVNVGDLPALTRRGLAAVVGGREDRVAMALTVRENVTLSILDRFFHHGVLNLRSEAAVARSAIAEYDVRCVGPNVEMASLSGGNQQKAAIAKVLQANPKIVVLEEPCHGVDARGRHEIRAMLARAATQGALVLVIDSDLEEVLGLCSRVVVLRNGEVAGEFRKGEMSRRGLLDACYG